MPRSSSVTFLFHQLNRAGKDSALTPKYLETEICWKGHIHTEFPAQDIQVAIVCRTTRVSEKAMRGDFSGIWHMSGPASGNVRKLMQSFVLSR